MQGWMIWIGLGAGMPLAAHEGTGWDVGVASMWSSRYVDAGVDELGEGGLWTFEAGVEREGLEFGVWTGLGDSVDYQELNAYAGYGWQWGEWDMALVYTRLEFKGDTGDNELAFELGREWGGFEWGLETTYSTEAGGSFVEVGVGYPIHFCEDRLWVMPYVREGIDFGYRSDAHDGLNHTEIGVEMRYAICDGCALNGFVAHSFAGEDVRRDGEGDPTWFGLGVEFGW